MQVFIIFLLISDNNFIIFKAQFQIMIGIKNIYYAHQKYLSRTSKLIMIGIKNYNCL